MEEGRYNADLAEFLPSPARLLSSLVFILNTSAKALLNLSIVATHQLFRTRNAQNLRKTS